MKLLIGIGQDNEQLFRPRLHVSDVNTDGFTLGCESEAQ